MTHLNYPLTNSGRTLNLQKEMLKTEMNHNEVDGNDYKDKKMNGWIMVNKMSYVLLLFTLDIVKLWKK